MVTKFTVWGEVVGKQRPRSSRSNGVFRTYTPKKTKDYEKAVREAYMAAGGQKHDGSVSVEIHVMRSLPKSRPKKVSSEPDVYKPDVDNIAKSILDGLSGVAFDDDKQVTRLLVVKHGRERRKERVEVIVESV